MQEPISLPSQQLGPHGLSNWIKVMLLYTQYSQTTAGKNLKTIMKIEITMLRVVDNIHDM